MISIKYGGRLGNRMYSNAYGFILSKKLDCKLNCESLEGFENTQCKKYDISTISEKSFHYKRDCDTNIYELYKNNKSNYHITIDGPFMNYKLYEPHLISLRHYFTCNIPLKITPRKNDLVIHLRSGDIWLKETMKKYNLNFGHHSKARLQKEMQVAIPVDFFCNIIDKNCFDNIIIVTEYKEDLICQKLKKIYENAIIVSESINHDFQLIRKANNIIMSVSTFSWWAAFLSNAEKIYYPNIGYFKNNVREHINLDITHDDRYIKVNLDEKFKRFHNEWCGDENDLKLCLSIDK